MDRHNWDDLRFVLAVAEEGSVSGAARRLGVNHATVLRRIAAYETAVGVEIFDKSARGYSVPEVHSRVIAAARDVDRAVQAVGRMVHGARAPLAGEVRITATDSLCQTILAPIVADLARDAPELKIDLICTNQHLDMSRAAADVTVRPTEALPDELRGEKAAVLAFGLFRARGSVSDHWLEPCGALARSAPGRWVAGNVARRRIAGGADSFMVLRECAAAGQGLAVLPLFLGMADSRLEPVAGLFPQMETGIWVASHADLHDIPRIRAARNALVAGIGARAGQLQGKG